MSSSFANLLIEAAQDPSVFKALRRDPQSQGLKHGLSETDYRALVSGQQTEVPPVSTLYVPPYGERSIDWNLVHRFGFEPPTVS